jgi:hypothetical protein
MVCELRRSYRRHSISEAFRDVEKAVDLSCVKAIQVSAKRGLTPAAMAALVSVPIGVRVMHDRRESSASIHLWIIPAWACLVSAADHCGFQPRSRAGPRQV